MTSKLTMARRQSICVAVLAAGQSRRFGDADKLAQPLGGKPLGLHICDTIQPLGLAHSLVITSAADHPCVPGWRDRGFEIAVNHAATEGLGGSVALAAKRHIEADERVIIMGEDVHRLRGGVIGAVKGIAEEYAERLMAMPI